MAIRLKVGHYKDQEQHKHQDYAREYPREQHSWTVAAHTIFILIVDTIRIKCPLVHL